MTESLIPSGSPDKGLDEQPIVLQQLTPKQAKSFRMPPNPPADTPVNGLFPAVGADPEFDRLVELFDKEPPHRLTREEKIAQMDEWDFENGIRRQFDV